MHAVTFMWPYAAFLILALVPLAFLHRRLGGERSYLKTNLLSVVRELNPGLKSPQKIKHLPVVLILLWTLMTLALMRPQFVGAPLELARSGRNIVLTLDISLSMEESDLVANQPEDRLSVAKSVLNNFIDHRKGDRLALVLFASESFLHAPLSFDHAMIKRFLEEAHIGFLGTKTAIGDAIGLSVKKLMEQPEDQERIMILLTDGQNNAGVLEPMQAAQLAKLQKVKIYIVGLGASRKIVEGFFGPGVVNPSVDLEEAEPELKKIAEMTGGTYFRAKDNKGLDNIYNIIDRMEPVVVDTQVIIPKKDLFYWPLSFAALVIIFHLALSYVMSARRAR